MIANEALRQLVERLEDEYGDLNKACGCTVCFKGSEHKWFSTKIIKDIIVELDEQIYKKSMCK